MGDVKTTDPRMSKAKVRVRFIKKENGQLSYVYTGTINTFIGENQVGRHQVNGGLEYTVAVPHGKVLKTSMTNGQVKKFLQFVHGNTQSKTHEVDDQNVVEVTVEWGNIEATHQPGIEVLSHPVEVTTVPGFLTVVYTIGDAMSFTEFIMVLRRILADHKDREDILDKFSINLSTSRQHPVLTKQHAEEPPWLHVKLQVARRAITLIMRVDSLYVCGFMDQNGKLYRLIDSKTASEAIIPRRHHNDIEDLDWTVSYKSMLGATDNEIVHKLTNAGLGRDFAMKAVRRLSGPRHPNDEVTGMTNGKLALGGLIVLVCESARLNPLHDSFARGWSTGEGFSEELMRKYVWGYYGKTSGKLRKWKSENYANLNPIPQLQAMHLVLNAPPPKTEGNDDGNPDPSTSSDAGGNAGNQNNNNGHAGNNNGNAGKKEGNDDGNPDPSTSSEEDGDAGRNSDNSKNTGEADDTLGHGRPLVELLAVRADLRVVGTKIIVFDRKRGQIIYRHAQQGEEGTTEDLVLTGPYRGISAYGSFTIKVDIPNADPARFEWDCYLPRNAKQVDAMEPSYGDIKAPNGSKVAEVTYAVMSNALEATVQVMLRLKDGHTLNDVHGEIKARIEGFKVGSILFKQTQGAGQCFSRDGDSFLLQLARNVVAVPCGKVLHIEVDLKMETPNGQGPKPLKVALKFDNGTLSRSSPGDNGNEVRVDIAWYPEISRPSHPPEQTSEEMGEQEPSHPVEAKMMSRREPDLLYTIGDEVSFTRFIMNLRRFVAEHPDQEDILERPVLAKQRAEQPARWLHIKLEVVEDKKTLSTTLLIRDDDLYVHGFMNQEGVCYELLETKDSTVNMIPEDEYNPHPLYWGLTYNTILNVQDGSEATAKLVTEGLGMSFAIEAVRRLSSSTHPDVEVDGEKSARVALAGLIVVVCESARMNPLRDAIAGGWSNGTGFTEQLMDRYVRKYGDMSRNLQKWKISNFDYWPHPISELQATRLVLNTQLPNVIYPHAGRPRVELLSIHADLGVVGTKIIVFDGKRGQIIYRHSKQREQGTTENLVLTGPYTGISAYLCFAIKIDIPDAGPMVFKWDCYNPQHAAQVDKPPMSHDMGNIAKVTYAVMSNALKATVQVKLRLNDEHSAVGIGGEITALIDGFEDEEDNRSILFRPEKRTCQSFSSTDNDSMILLQLARNVLAVPYGTDLRIKVDLEIETSNNQGIKNLRADLCIANGILSQCHVVDGGEVEVNVTWYPQEEITYEHQHEVVYTIGDARSYRGFIMALCRILTNHPDHEGILDGPEHPKLSTRQHPLLLSDRMDRWLHIKLQVAGEGTSVTLAIGMDDLRVHGFTNENEYRLWYRPEDYKKWLSSQVNLHWGYGYDSILGVNSHEGIVGKLASETQGLGKTTAVNAVRVLSRFHPHVHLGKLEAGGDKYYDARVALVCLSVMVCDSARLNPVLKHIESGWKNGAGLTKELEGYIKNWNRISSALQDWKEDSYRTWMKDERLERIGIKSPEDALDVVHLCSAERMRRF
ncbi:uncharacterized protein [Setaria viridis]|uniref:DUF6598 domain-containing protein n=3 Tax=Setaria viridis TaxID=4556 RepID=A0A4V6Y7W6_SETVI|nr:uncharacterized protein LOC117866166 isoform X2 [Setaria viridis]XP_034606204.1 uncharacterized protein LOC117866166 isoform X2 [Setaria viridis]XP_034606205.1 uncharacterized protein LOC117866166 isoform X2 [Setaria viridis]TKV99405.1 hypothetical protein SEVIR_8G041300v2 [Setaria viridis]